MNNVNQPAFTPDPAATVNLGVTASTGRVLVRTTTKLPRHCRIYNSSATVIVFVESGGSTVTASTSTSMPIPPGEVEVISLLGDYVAAIGSAAGPTTVYFTPGEGI